MRTLRGAIKMLQKCNQAHFTPRKATTNVTKTATRQQPSPRSPITNPRKSATKRPTPRKTTRNSQKCKQAPSKDNNHKSNQNETTKMQSSAPPQGKEPELQTKMQPGPKEMVMYRFGLFCKSSFYSVHVLLELACLGTQFLALWYQHEEITRFL